MKKFITIFAILIITLLSFSCSKSDDSSTPATPTADYFLKAKIDGVQYQTDAAYRVLASNTDDRITITSILSDGRNFEIIVDYPTGTGDYSFPAPITSSYFGSLKYGDTSATNAIWGTNGCPGTTGTLTITALSMTEISGTFSFTGKKTGNCADAPKVITEGSFKSGITQ